RGRNRQAILDRLASGEAAIAVGTHALFQEGVAFRDLALAVIDEQHRFGVDQRLTLAAKGEANAPAYVRVAGVGSVDDIRDRVLSGLKA
ncbi:hypothetical protein, partial [uncultured Spongiibacter sp.]|uniref:hypothetical protein n=1 Tax=uncultured Spongiibacter sp. TaxID=870896 RepID=UPI002591D6F5